MQLKLRGFCSKNKVPFFVLAEVNNDVMHWIGASPLPPKLDSNFYSASDQLMVSRQYRIVSAGWHCPICGTGGSEQFGEFWHCETCKEYHCMGMADRVLHGRCGKCKIDPGSLRIVDTFNVKGIGTNE